MIDILEHNLIQQVFFVCCTKD